MFIHGSGTKGILNEVSKQFWRLFGGYTGTYGDLCWPAGLEATRLVLGENKHSPPWDIANAKLIVCWGKNPAETNIHQTNFIHKAQEAGAKLIVIDPRRTPTADRADSLIQIRPGTDGALALAVAKILIEKDQIDHPFIENHVHGFTEFSTHVKKYSIAYASQISGVPHKSIVELANDIGTISPLTICGGYGMQRYTNSGQAVRAIIALLAITGNLGKPGAGWVYANLTSHIFDKQKVPFEFYPPEKPDGIARITVSIARLGTDMMKQTDPPIKMIWVERGNPLSQVPETPKVIQAFQKADFRVVVEQFITDTARQADIVLPAKTMFEQSNVINAYWHDYIQLLQKVIEPPGEVKPETEIYRLLAQELGFDQEDIDRYLPGPGDEEVIQYLRRKLEPFPGITIERLKEGPLLSPFHQEVAWEDHIYPTPSRKIELFSNEAAKRWRVHPLPDFKEPVESVKQAGRKKYPIYLITPNTKNTIHSQFRNLRVIKDIEPEAMATVHPLDAQERSIADGDRIRIFNDRGQLHLKARYDYSLRQGCVVVYNGWWYKDGAGVNHLSKGRETDMAFGAAFHDTTVEFEKVK
jgi:anaerobic selenocysteine-containing dehydrogenase